MRRPSRLVALGLSTLLALGCSTTATLSTRAASLEAEILGGDRDTLYVRDSSGAALSVPRREVREIDHPGNVYALVGGILLGFFAAETAAFFSTCVASGSNSLGPGLCVVTGSFAAAGAGMFTFGMWAWLRSKFAATSDLIAPPPGVRPASEALQKDFGAPPTPALSPVPAPL